MKNKFYKFIYIDKKGQSQVEAILAGSLEMATEKLKLENEVGEIKSRREIPPAYKLEKIKSPNK